MDSSEVGALGWSPKVGFCFRLQPPWQDADSASLQRTLKAEKIARWDSVAQVWIAGHHVEDGERALSFAEAHGLRVGSLVRPKLDELRADRARRIAASHADSTSFDVDGLGGTLLPFQRAGVEYALGAISKHGFVYFGDSMGLGKTCQALATAQAADAYPFVVVCPAFLKPNWRREAQMWLPGRRVRIVEADSDPEAGFDIYIVSYDYLGKVERRISDLPPKMIVWDEAHYLQSPTSKRTEVSLRVGAFSSRKLMLSGTPALNRPADLIAQFQVGGVMRKLFGSTTAFKQRFCDLRRTEYGWSANGATNSEELNRLLRSEVYVRREKKDVLKELPPKRVSVQALELDGFATYRRIEGGVVGGKSTLRGFAAAEALRTAAVRCKLPAAHEWVDNFLKSEQKLVLFAIHHEVLRGLIERYKDAARIVAWDTPDKRQENADRFQQDDSCKLLIGALGTSAINSPAGVGWTLTAASNVAFLEFPWNPGALDQAADRLHRLGQSAESVNVWLLIAENTIDEDMLALIEWKRKVLEPVTQGVRTEEESDTAFLLNRIKERRGETNIRK